MVRLFGDYSVGPFICMGCAGIALMVVWIKLDGLSMTNVITLLVTFISARISRFILPPGSSPHMRWLCCHARSGLLNGNSMAGFPRNRRRPGHSPGGVGVFPDSIHHAGQGIIPPARFKEAWFPLYPVLLEQYIPP